jgi:hypothetical protein
MWTMRRSLISALLVALALLATAAVPVTALAQSVGDDQYADPIPHNNGGGENGGGGGSNGGGSNTGGGSGGSAGAGTSTPSAPSTAAGTPSSSGGGAEGTATKNGQLPRTGFDVLLTIELGMAMLLIGVVGQRMIVLRERRDQR